MEEKRTWTQSSLLNPPMVTVKIGEYEWIVHQNVLQHESGYFKASFRWYSEDPEDKNMVIFDPEDVDPEYFDLFVRFMYAAASSGCFQLPENPDTALDFGRLEVLVNIVKMADYFSHETIVEQVLHDIEWTFRDMGVGCVLVNPDRWEDLWDALDSFIQGWIACGDIPRLQESKMRIAQTLAYKLDRGLGDGPHEQEGEEFAWVFQESMLPSDLREEVYRRVKVGNWETDDEDPLEWEDDTEEETSPVPPLDDW